MTEAASNPNVLDNADKVKMLNNVLKTNVSVCISVGSFFYPQLTRIFMDMLGLYKEVSNIINNDVAAPGTIRKQPQKLSLLILWTLGANPNIVTRTPKVRGLRAIKRDILRLVETYIKKAEDLEAVNEHLIPPLLDAVLGDYSRNVPSARDAEVLNVMTTIMTRLGVGVLPR